MNRAWWDEAAATEEEARRACWSEPGDSWSPSIEACLPEILPTADLVGRWYAPRMLDLGCGVGRLTFPVARHLASVGRAEVIGLDVSPKMIAHAERRRRAEGVGNAMFVIGNGSSLPDAIRPLAMVWSMLLFQHLAPLAVQDYIAEVARLLNKGGVFRLQFVEGHDRSQPLSQAYGEDEIIGWLKAAGLDIHEVNRGRVYEVWTWVTAVRA